MVRLFSFFYDIYSREASINIILSQRQYTESDATQTSHDCTLEILLRRLELDWVNHDET